MQQIKDVLDYEPATGIFRWKKPTSNRNKVGGGAGTISNGYVSITVLGQRIYAHRLAFWWVHGRWPREVDHINRDRTDNRITNLREVTRGENVANTHRRDNKSGVPGVYYNPACGQRPWVAYKDRDGKRKYLGYFATKEQAMEARYAAE